MKKLFSKIKRKLVKVGTAALAALTVFGAVTQTNMITSQAAAASVVYQVHGQNYGWQGEKRDGQTGGTTNQSLRMEGIKAGIRGIGGSLEYRVHVEGYGWLPWTSNFNLAGTVGESRRIEAIEFRLKGEVANHYYIEYRSHCQNIGWTNWVRSGVSGTTGQSLRMEAIEIRLVSKGGNNVSADFSRLQSQYPSGSIWNSSYKNKAWECHGFACMLADKLTNSDPYTWTKKYNLNSLKPGDVVRFNHPHSILITGVNGNTVTYVDSNWVGKNKVQWNQTCTKNQLTQKFGSLSYVMSNPK